MIIQSSSSFDKKYKKLIKKGNFSSEAFEEVLKRLQEGKLLQSDRDHKWIGPYKSKKNLRELHIKPDWLLLYYIKNDIIYLVDTGTHSDLIG